MAKKIQKKNLKTILIFLILFNLLAIPMYCIIYFQITFEPLERFVAYITKSILSLFGYKIVQNGSFLSLLVDNKIFQIEISWDCTGWKSIYTLISLMLITPVVGIIRKLKYITCGVVVLFFLNIVRIVTTILLSVNYGFEYFNLIHTILWREGLILSVVLIWSLWLWHEKHNIRQYEDIIRDFFGKKRKSKTRIITN